MNEKERQRNRDGTVSVRTRLIKLEEMEEEAKCTRSGITSNALGDVTN